MTTGETEAASTGPQSRVGWTAAIKADVSATLAAVVWGFARDFGRRVAVAIGTAIRDSTFGHVPSAHQRLYQRQHVVEAA